MRQLGNILSAIGVVFFAIGCIYWVWFALQPRMKVLRSNSPKHALGCLTIIGLFVFALGRVFAKNG